MVLYHIFILALIQGITEFLPISSSGHLVLAHNIFDTSHSWKENILIDVAVHVGTLFSVILYFRKDIVSMLAGLKALVFAKEKQEGASLAFYVILGSAPVIIAGFILYSLEPDWLRSPYTVAWATFIFGIVLWWSDKNPSQERTLADMNWKIALGIGCAQMLALIPGTSRSGITMSAARFYGFSRVQAARFSLLLSLLAISGAGVLNGANLLKEQQTILTYHAIIAMFLAFISGWIAIHLMMKWLKQASFTPFALYRIILGLILLGLLYTGSLV